jgi:glycosyltransferase involved in cell wall biosynthesis
MLTGLGEVWVITRANNREAIEGAPAPDGVHFSYVDLPKWGRFWKRGRRGIHIYYLLWQIAALRRARELVKGGPFDLAWHLTIANVWMGSVAPLTKLPTVFGPVGGGVSPPWRLARVLGARGLLHEVARSTVRSLARYANPLARSAWRHSDLILVQNEETKRWLPAAHRHKTSVLPNPMVEGPRRSDAEGERWTRTALYAGELIPLKGVALAIRTLARLPEWKLIICGRGRDEARLRRMVGVLELHDRIEFRGWVPHVELMSLMGRASVLLFPSLHDEGGFVVVEALSRGLPVVCLNRGGPPALGGTSVRASSPDVTVRDLADAMEKVVGTNPSAPPDQQVRKRELAGLLHESGLITSEAARLFAGEEPDAMVTDGTPE